MRALSLVLLLCGCTGPELVAAGPLPLAFIMPEDGAAVRCSFDAEFLQLKVSGPNGSTGFIITSESGILDVRTQGAFYSILVAPGEAHVLESTLEYVSCTVTERR